MYESASVYGKIEQSNAVKSQEFYKIYRKKRSWRQLNPTKNSVKKCIDTSATSTFTHVKYFGPNSGILREKIMKFACSVAAYLLCSRY